MTGKDFISLVLYDSDNVVYRHEHLYGDQIQEHLIISDKFNIETGRAKLQGISVVLCTLSMLSNYKITLFTKQIPLKTLVVDEASQIEVGDYISVFSSFKTTLRKVCFIGDDKQCRFYFSIIFIF